MGSYIIRNNDLSVISPANEPVLPVLLNTSFDESGGQISIENPDDNGSNYKLNYTTNKLFQSQIDLSSDLNFQAYYNGKSQFSTGTTKDQTSQISIAAGFFKNKLATIYNKAKYGEISSAEFGPLYSLWLKYYDKSAKTDDKIIGSFYGMSFYTSKGVSTKDEIKFDHQMSSSGKYPFLSYQLDGSVKWGSSSNMKSSTNTFYTYMFEKPNLTTLPTVDDIEKTWKLLSKITNPINTLTTKNIPSDQPLLLSVTFGPLPYQDVINLVSLDFDYSKKNMEGNSEYIKSIKLIKDNPISNGNGYYTFKISIERDEQKIMDDFNSINNIANISIPFRLFIDKPINDKYLDIKYDKYDLTTERYPNPFCEVYDVIPSLNPLDNTFKYNTKVRFKLPNINMVIINSPKPPRVIDLLGLPLGVSEDLKKSILASKFTLTNINEYNLEFDIPLNSKHFNINQRSYDLEAVIEFSANNNRYIRKLPLRINAPKQLIETNNIVSNITFKDNIQLINSLNLKAKVNDDITISDLKNQFDKGENFDTLAFIEALKKVTNLSITSDNSYVIDPKYLIINKVTESIKNN
ncbi:hypothetical protein BWI97_14415 [Siphonobacter sp. BAB-5405]|uniref:hypothetical protein n=1 Tax=Siphonobacter sp. BAB-5405 TaxID=1864825 RepID=UPI000C7F9C1E|nr:hypothetical protein [Siphonobacter sp. BAB-5405]PMD95546.1 hypothetical protein BWI97_14415 [Siphonobacter sp. BAB-5405]